MSRKCIVTTRNNLGKFNTDVDVYYIEDYIGFGNIVEAREVTEKIYTSNKEYIQNYDYDGYKVTWAWYDQVYQLSLKYTEIKELVIKLDTLSYDIIEIVDIDVLFQKVISHYFFDKQIVIPKINNLINRFKYFSLNAMLLVFTFISILYFSLRNKSYVALRTEDMVFKGTTSDFRLNHLYEKLKSNQVNYIEFIRSRGLKDFITNTLKRKRFAIYYDSISYFIGLFIKNEVYNKEPKSFYESILFESTKSNKVLINSIKYLKSIYKLCNIKKVITIIGLASRSASMTIAAKSLGIKNIGIMHGLSVRHHNVFEYMEVYEENKSLGADVFGVWSEDQLAYFKKYCKIVPRDKIMYSGLLRPIKSFQKVKFSRISNRKIKVLIISEPLVNPREILPYIKKIMEDNRFEVAIKIRPMIKDRFYEELKILYPEISQIPKYDGKILEDGINFDIFIGSYSTAVVEASLIGKISILIKTHKWKDYYGINNIIDGENILVEIPEDICNNIIFRIENECNINSVDIIRKKFFGNNKDGADWILEQIKND